MASQKEEATLDSCMRASRCHMLNNLEVKKEILMIHTGVILWTPSFSV